MASRSRVQGGIATSDVVCSSFVGGNSEIFPSILDLHVPDGSKIADVTYGKGVFWRNVDLSRYQFFPSDLQNGIDARALPYESESFDAIVFDPPYMEGFYRREQEHLAGDGSHSAFYQYYSNLPAEDRQELKYHDRVVDIYMLSAIEALRVLKKGGTYIVKCQDEVSANRQKLTHVELIYGLEGLGFYCKDLFVITRVNAPGVSRLLKQEHARKNHSYFLVFKKAGKKLPYVNCSQFVETYWDIALKRNAVAASEKNSAHSDTADHNNGDE